MRRYAAVILAGGRARRLGGVDKPSLAVGGVPLLHRVLAAVSDADPRVVVGPSTPAPPAGVLRTREEPAGGGPVAATAAGLALVPPDVTFVALLAADLPFLDHAAVTALRAAAEGPAEGAVYEDGTGRRQWLCGVWRAAALRARLAALPGGGAGTSLRALFDGATVARLRHPPDHPQPPPWFDCDTEADLRRAARWAEGGSAGHGDRRGG